MKRMRIAAYRATAVFCAAALLAPAAAMADRRDAQIPAGTRFLVELRDKLDAHKVHPGKKFEARTLEPLQGPDGGYIPEGAKVKGRVTYVRDDQMELRFEQIETPGGRVPLVATVSSVIGEKNVKERTGEEGEIKSRGHSGRDAAIGAVLLGGLGAAVGGTQAGAKGAAIGAGAGAASGALIGAAAGHSGRLVLYDGTRLELTLDNPIYFRDRR